MSWVWSASADRWTEQRHEPVLLGRVRRTMLTEGLPPALAARHAERAA